MMVLFQWAENDGPINLHDIWKEPVHKTLRLLEKIASGTVVGFNLAFDWFHVVKIYTIWSLLPADWIPEEHIHEIAMVEPLGQQGLCIKPYSACDLLLHSRKNQYQVLMAREDIRIRKVPTVLAGALAEKLEKTIELDGILFARNADKDAPRWRVYDIFKHGELEPDFKDVVLKFNAAGGLKFLAEYALGKIPKYHYSDVEIDKSLRPVEFGFAPTALAVSSPDTDWAVWEQEDGKAARIKGYAWPGLIKQHIDHWFTREDARDYASDDILYTRELYEHFGKPQPGDDDSILATAIPVVRWHGFEVNMEGIDELLVKAKHTVANSPVSVTRPQAVRDYLQAAMDPSEALFISETTKKAKLEAISKWIIEEDEECTLCGCKMEVDPNCVRCLGTGQMKLGPHPAAARAAELLAVKQAVKEIELYDKLKLAKKFHASFNIIGTMSSRMSGGDGLNAQGIKKTKEVRCNFPLTWGPTDMEQFREELWAYLQLKDAEFNEVWDRVQLTLNKEQFLLCGGDFDAFEITLADAVYNDPELRQALIAGRKIHGLFGTLLFPGKTYEEVLASEGSKYDMYTMAKSGVFAMIYGGNAETLHRNLGIPFDVATAAYEQWGKMFPGIEKARQRIIRAFCTMKQLSNRQVVWSEPNDYCETFLGFRRYFTLENKIAKALFDLGVKPPKEWKLCNAKVVRRDRLQTAGGAVGSALFGAAFAIQQAVARAAANHEIQSPGGNITKKVQRLIWDLQPSGVGPLFVAPMNIHDEIQCATHPDYVERVAQAVKTGVESYRDKVALIGMTWNKEMANWAEKKGGSVTLKIKPPELMAA